MPRFDSPAIFARILGDDAGHWSIRPDTDFHVERQYVAASMVLLTTFHTSTGTLELCDALVLGDTKDPHALGEHAPHLLGRTMTCTSGRVVATMTFQPRPGVRPDLPDHDAGGRRGRGHHLPARAGRR